MNKIIFIFLLFTTSLLFAEFDVKSYYPMWLIDENIETNSMKEDFFSFDNKTIIHIEYKNSKRDCLLKVYKIVDGKKYKYKYSNKYKIFYKGNEIVEPLFFLGGGLSNIKVSLKKEI